MSSFFGELGQVSEFECHDRADFSNDVLKSNTPMVLRGFARQWPAVSIAERSDADFHQYLRSQALETEVTVFSYNENNNGNLAYTKDLSAYAFQSSKVPFTTALDDIFSARNNDSSKHYCGSVPVSGCLSEFKKDHAVSFLDSTIEPRIWLGNASKVSAHYDVSDNIACVVSGSRKFTLIPPDQISNLYVGPIDFNLAGRPASLVDLDQPDLKKHPRIKEALSVGLQTQLYPGDAIFIPTLWWHQVESIGDFNCLVNYWWSKTNNNASEAYEALIHGLLTISGMPEAQRMQWRSFYDHYVFRLNGDPAEHIPEHKRGVLGNRTPEINKKIKQFLFRSMSSKH